MINKNKTVLITGSATGIGRAISIKFAENNWSLLCHYNSSNEEVNSLKKYLDKIQCNYIFIKSDFSDKYQLLSFVDAIKHYTIDSIINNAGTYIKNGHFSNIDLSDVINLFMVNFFSSMMIVSSLFPFMMERKFGRIVNISSIAAKYGGSVCSMPYGCSKRAIEGITKTFAKEGAERNVLVNSIRPGLIDTNFHKRTNKNLDKRISMIPMKKMGKSNDIGDIAYYLGSDKNNFITNDIITIAGGE